MKLSKKNSFYIKTIASIFIIVLVGFLLLEGATRLFLPDRRYPPVVPPEIGQFDAMLGWSLKPLSQATSSATGNEIEYSINSKGLRDDETPYEKPEGIFRIVLLGDSFTFGYGVPIKKHFSTLLEGYFENVEVINMGVSGFGVDQELLYLRHEGYRYEPDLVLAFVNHYGDHRHMHTQRFGKAKPRFVRVDGEIDLKNSPVPMSPEAPYLNMHNWILSHSNAYATSYRGIMRLMVMVGLTSQEQQDSTFSRKRQDKENLEDALFKKELYDLGEALIYTMQEESLAHGATFLLVTTMKELYETKREKKILILDVRRALSNPKFPLPEPYGHINESGNGVLAWEIAKFLQTNQPIPAHVQKKFLLDENKENHFSSE